LPKTSFFPAAPLPHLPPVFFATNIRVIKFNEVTQALNTISPSHGSSGLLQHTTGGQPEGPDLFIIYTGHNEFLEERTYSQIKDIPPVIRSTVSMLAHIRTWSVMTIALQNLGIYPETEI